MVKAGRHDPNNKAWSENKSRFGFRMMQKMGWQEGKGLGANEDGTTEHVKVKTKEDNSGLGTGLDVSSWKGNTFKFEDTLARLHEQGRAKTKKSPSKRSSSVASDDSSSAGHTPGVYVPSSPKTGAAPLVATRRMYNRKLVRAKQEFKKDEEGKLKIVGKIKTEKDKKKEKRKKEAEELKIIEDNLTEMQNSSSLSMADYFATKAVSSGKGIATVTEHVTFASWNAGKSELAPSEIKLLEKSEKEKKKKKRVRSVSRSPRVTPRLSPKKRAKKERKEEKEEEKEPIVVVVPSPRLSPRHPPRAAAKRKDKKEKKEKKSKKEKKDKKE